MRWVVCGGGLRSGSVLQYNLVGVYLELLGMGRRMGYGSHAWMLDQNPDFEASELIGVVKTHPVDDWGPLLETGEAVALTTRRDEAGTRMSMTAMFGDDSRYEESEGYREAWQTRALLTQEYSDLAAPYPYKALGDIKTALQLPFRQPAFTQAVKTARRSALRGESMTVEPGGWHPTSLVHYDHFKD